MSKSLACNKELNRPGMVRQACNHPNTWETEAGRLKKAGGQSGLQNKSQNFLGYRETRITKERNDMNTSDRGHFSASSLPSPFGDPRTDYIQQWRHHCYNETLNFTNESNQ